MGLARHTARKSRKYHYLTVKRVIAAKRRRILRDLAKCVKCQTQMLPEARKGATEGVSEGLTQGPNRPGAGTRGLVDAMLPVM